MRDPGNTISGHIIVRLNNLQNYVILVKNEKLSNLTILKYSII